MITRIQLFTLTNHIPIRSNLLFITFKAALREGFVRPPNAMDGIPAPISRLTSMDDASVAKEIVSQALHYDLEADITESTASPYWTEDMTWYKNLIKS